MNMDELFEKRHCYTITINCVDENGYIPSMVFEGVKGHFPMKGQGEGANPWYFGKTYEGAQSVCDKVNKEKFGLDPLECAKIVCSSMF